MSARAVFIVTAAALGLLSLVSAVGTHLASGSSASLQDEITRAGAASLAAVVVGYLILRVGVGSLGRSAWVAVPIAVAVQVAIFAAGVQPGPTNSTLATVAIPLVVVHAISSGRMAGAKPDPSR